MAAGVTLAVIGAILTFAVRADPSGIDLQVVGLILMVAGGGLIWHAAPGHDPRAGRHPGARARSDDPSGCASPITEHRTVRETHPGARPRVSRRRTSGTAERVRAARRSRR